MDSADQGIWAGDADGEAAGLTQAQFAKLTGVCAPAVVNWEGSKSKAPIRLKVEIPLKQAIRGMS